MILSAARHADVIMFGGNETDVSAAILRYKTASATAAVHLRLVSNAIVEPYFPKSLSAFSANRIKLVNDLSRVFWKVRISSSVTRSGSDSDKSIPRQTISYITPSASNPAEVGPIRTSFQSFFSPSLRTLRETSSKSFAITSKTTSPSSFGNLACLRSAETRNNAHFKVNPSPLSSLTMSASFSSSSSSTFTVLLTITLSPNCDSFSPSCSAMETKTFTATLLVPS
mmetsp:Transcript_5535/g.16146  ORF Transcript_5535/g.16146 Transcript_5535/m.16146 type:complete len:226 (+) Transcript_5535:1996-2673(+)